MARILKSYVDEGFLIGFLEYGKNWNNWDTNEKAKVWRNLNEFLHEKTKLAISFSSSANKVIQPTKQPSLLLRFLKRLVSLMEEKSRSELSEEEFEIQGSLNYSPQARSLRSRIDLYFQGVEEMEYVEELPSESNTISYSNIKFYDFIFTSNDQIVDIEKRYGVAVFTKMNFFQKWNIFAKNEPPLLIPERSEDIGSDGWQILEKFRHPINAILMIDRYFFDFYLNIENNLFPLLKVLLSDQKLDIPLDLTILTEKIKQNMHTQIQEKDLMKIYSRIAYHLKNEMGFNLVNLTLCKIPSYLGPKIHDRQIFTNYFFITSGSGFGCFNKNGQSSLPMSTTIQLTPVTNYNLSHKKFIKQKRNIMQHKDTKLIGTGNNRLFET